MPDILPASATGAPAHPAPRSWREIVAPYARAHAGRGWLQLLNTGGPFLLLVGLMVWGLDQGLWPAIALALPAAGLLVRLFSIQHDCGHGSFFHSPRANDRLRPVPGLLTQKPHATWRQTPSAHPATP